MATDPAGTDSALSARRYRGRFAPSPTGPLHFGSLVAAMASYLQALVNDGDWFVRIEDIDPPREVPGAADAIIAALAAHGFRWHGDIVYQHRHTQRFRDVVTGLLDVKLAYACSCSRQKIRAVSRRGPAGPIYPGTCRSRAIAPRADSPCAIRLRTTDAPIGFDDALRGHIEYNVRQRIGDFVIRRKDGLIAYNLAVVIDDADERITEIVRGLDLVEFTPAQIYLQKVLGLAQPAYCHVPIVSNPNGEKLSKQSGATAVDNTHAAANLVRGLDFLGQAPPADLKRATVDEVWDWARESWSLTRLAKAAQTSMTNLK